MAEARAVLACFRLLDPCPAATTSFLEPKSLRRKEVSQRRKDPWENSQPSKQRAWSGVFSRSFGTPASVVPLEGGGCRRLQVLARVVKQSGRLSPCQKVDQGSPALGIQPYPVLFLCLGFLSWGWDKGVSRHQCSIGVCMHFPFRAYIFSLGEGEL